MLSMTIFDLLFLALVLATLVTLITAAVAAVRGNRGMALRILGRLAICALVYVSVVVAVALAAPQRILHVGDPWCFDDWCLSVERVTRTAALPQATYTVSLRLFSRARRVSQRAKFAWVYLIDGHGHRYAPEPDASAIPLDVLAGAGRVGHHLARVQGSRRCRRTGPDHGPRGTLLLSESHHWGRSKLAAQADIYTAGMSASG